MGNFALQTGPCSFLKLRISPWGNLFLLLLCSLLSGAFILSPPAAALAKSLFSPPSLFPPLVQGVRVAPGGSASGGGGARQCGPGAGGARRLGAGRRASARGGEQRAQRGHSGGSAQARRSALAARVQAGAGA
jgi:hypothetical protein